ncbi:hypothetical protein GQ54DRAFT_253730 [Martensiomyces pterosporus]|nr:hypothetical protein GQ54DRAFT_253730 [Martensiomyces pterosporus]
MSHSNALPFPATSSALAPQVERTLQLLNGPMRDANNSLYELAAPLERSVYSACPACGLSFNLLRRKHNCVNCGQVVCSDCLPSKWYLPKYGLKSPVPCCSTCDRNLRLSIRSKEELERSTVRELRAYLQLYGLYNPSRMIEKGDLVGAVFNNSPVSQINELKYRSSLPRPSGNGRQQQQQQQQQQHERRHSSGSNSGSSWDRMFTSIGNDIGRGMESLGQQLGDMFDSDSSSSQRRTRQNGMYEQVPAYDSHTYSHPNPRTRPQAHTQTQTQSQQQRPHSAQSATQSSARRAPPPPRAPQSTGSSASTQQPQPSHSPPTPGRAHAARATAGTASAVEVPRLTDLVHNKTDVNSLSAKVLKALLNKYHVDYSNIVEKSELVQRVERLVANTRLEMDREAADKSGSGHSADDDLCKICWDEATNCVLLNCGHMCTCLECGERIFKSERRECPICREYISRIVHVFRA